MKFSEIEFTLDDVPHLLRAECESKFSGSVLELKLDGKSVSLSTGVQKYRFFRMTLEGSELVIFVNIATTGIPELELLYEGTALSNGKEQAVFLEEIAAAGARDGKVAILKNALLNFLLFTAAGLVVGVFRQSKHSFNLNAILIGLLCGTVVTLLFLLWDVLDMRIAKKALRKGIAAPTLIDLDEEEALDEAVDEEIDPDSVEIPGDSVSFYQRLREAEEVEEAEETEETGEAAEKPLEKDAAKAKE